MSDGFVKKGNSNKKSAYIMGGIIGVVITLVLMLEVLDANSNEYVAGWQDNPPEEWFSIIEG